MSIAHSLISTSPILCNKNPQYYPSSAKSRSPKCSTFLLHTNSVYSRRNMSRNGLRKPHLARKAVNTKDPTLSSFDDEEISIDFDCDDDLDEGSPWEGAIIYQRNASVSHIEYCTTLERLGLHKLSSEVSRSTASAMGLRVTKAVKEYVDGTPVLISADVTRKKRKLRLDGIIRSVITLFCYRCGEPAAESVFPNFSLLLTEEPVVDSDIINMETIYGEDRLKSSAGTAGEEDEDDELIHLEDRLYFPSAEKHIDISKQIRDLIHLEITMNSVCNPKCKGLCLQCGTNLNTRICSCNRESNDTGFGPLGDLRKHM